MVCVSLFVQNMTLIIGQLIFSVSYVRVQQLSEGFCFGVLWLLYGGQPLDEFLWLTQNFIQGVYHSVLWYLILRVVYENIRDDDSLLWYDVIPYTEDLTGQMITCFFTSTLIHIWCDMIRYIISYISYHIAMTQSSTKICQSCCSKWPIMQDDKHEQNQPTMLSRIPTLEIVWGSDSVT